jgi:hypothetical protein
MRTKEELDLVSSHGGALVPAGATAAAWCVENVEDMERFGEKRQKSVDRIGGTGWDPDPQAFGTGGFLALEGTRVLMRNPSRAS